MSEGKVLTGKVCWFNSRTGIGFITKDDGTGDVFSHWTNIVNMEGFKTLKEGQAVEFEIGANHRGPQAINIRILPNA